MLVEEIIERNVLPLIEQNPDVLVDVEGYLNHLKGSYEVAEKVVLQEVRKKYPYISLNDDTLSIAAGIHDIGRPLKKDQRFHEIRGSNYIRDNELYGLDYEQRDKIAKMVRTHGFVYELWKLCGQNYTEEFGSIDVTSLYPKSWEEFIVIYSDISNKKGEFIEPEERLKEALYRYEKDINYKDPEMIHSIKTGTKRILDICENVRKLKDGELTEKEIKKYNFLG